MSLSTLPWQVSIIIGVLFTCIGQVFNKYQVNRGSVFQVLLYKYLGSFFLVGTLMLVFGLDVPTDWLIILAYGFFVGINVSLYTAASRVSLSRTVLTTPMGMILSIVASSIVLKEFYLFDLSTQGGRQLVLAFLMVPVLILLLTEKGKVKEKWSWYVIFFALFHAGSRLFNKYYLTNNDPVPFAMFQYSGSLLSGLMGSMIKNKQIFSGKKFALRGFIQGMFTASAIVFYYSALQKATIAQTGLLRAPLFIIMTTLIGLIVFKEVKSMSRKKWLGIGVALVITVLVITANH